MLLPPQVIPFLEHEDEEVRQLAAKYLADAHDPAPATADDFWRAIDKLGFEGSSPLSVYLYKMPQTEASVDRLLAALQNTDKLDENTRYHLLRTFEKVPLDLLARRRDEWLPIAERLDAEVHAHLTTRLQLMGQSPQSLWEQLVQHTRDIDDQYADKFDWNISRRLREALARHPDFAAERAMATLSNPHEHSWLEVFCVQLIGQLRHRPAIDLLIEKMKDEDSDLLPSEAGRALAQIADVEVIRKLEAIFPSQPEHFRNTVGDILSNLKRPETEAAFLRLLEKEEDPGPRTFLAMGLCDLCTTDGQDAVRQLALSGDYDEGMVNLRELLLPLSKMTGYQFPEAAAWQGEADAARVRRVQREKQFEAAARKAKLGDRTELSALMLEAIERMSKMSGQRRHEPPRPPQFPEPRPEPLRRASVKIGRNDPCPCGSGKKYKKCCLAKDEAEG